MSNAPEHEPRGTGLARRDGERRNGESVPPGRDGPVLRAEALARACPLAICAVTLDGRVTAWNPAAERLFGWSAAEVMGRPTPVVPRPAWTSFLGSLAQMEAEGGFGEYDAERLHRDGSLIEVHVATAPLVNDEGRTVGMVAIFQDIRARKRHEEALRAQVHLLQAIVDGIPAPIFYKDARGAYLGCNQAFCAYVGKRHEEIVGKTVHDAWPKDLADVYHAADVRLLESRGTQIYEARVAYADGSRHDVVFHKGVFFLDDGAVGGQVGTILDITDRKRIEQALRESEERYRTVVSALEEGILLKDRDGRTLAHNAGAERILGLDGARLEAHVGLGPPLDAIDEEGDPLGPERFPAAITLATGAPLSNVVAGLRREDGSLVWISVNSRPLVRAGEEAPHAVVLSFSDITVRRLSEERLAQHAYYDAVTGLPNRVLFQRRLEEEIRAAAQAGASIAVLFLDLDGFKVVNDTLGHAAGDQLLQIVARRIAGCVREGDTVARMGGDEFIAVLTGVEEAAQATIVADRIGAAVGAPIDIAGQEVFVGVSIGIALHHAGDAEPEALIRNADSAMYRAKETGKNRHRIYSPGMGGDGPERLTLESQLRRAIERDQFVLHCQPKLMAAGGRLTGFEVLLRWQHPDRGLLPPGAFLRIAEESGLIVPVGAWVLRRACTQSAAWLRAGLLPPRVAVNASVRQLDDGAFVDTVARVLDETGLPARLLEIEVTEGALIRDPAAAARELGRLRALGVTIAVDDFGTGYSSLSYLQRLPIDCLKIDRAFVEAMEAPAPTLPLVQAIVSMARALGLTAVAEGVETPRQLELLRDLGCEEVQGYLLGRPIPSADFAARWLPPR